MNIKLPNSNFAPKSIILSDIDINYGYMNSEVYRACADFTDYPDYPIYKGDYIVIVFNGLIVIGQDSVVVIDKCSLSQENWTVPIELVSCNVELIIQ